MRPVPLFIINKEHEPNQNKYFLFWEPVKSNGISPWFEVYMKVDWYLMFLLIIIITDQGIHNKILTVQNLHKKERVVVWPTRMSGQCYECGSSRNVHCFVFIMLNMTFYCLIYIQWFKWKGWNRTEPFFLFKVRLCIPFSLRLRNSMGH